MINKEEFSLSENKLFSFKQTVKINKENSGNNRFVQVGFSFIEWLGEGIKMFLLARITQGEKEDFRQNGKRKCRSFARFIFLLQDIGK